MKPDYLDLLNDVIRNGRHHESRIGGTYEKFGVQVNYPAGEMFKRPGMSRQLGWMEVLQSVGGFFDAEMLHDVAPGSIPGVFGTKSCFGPQWREQFKGVAEQLLVYPESRRALVFFDERAYGYEDTRPCATVAQFFIRRGTISLQAYQRSWDLVNGFMYDTMVYSGLLLAMAQATGWTPGWVTVTAGSGHVYEKDLNAQRTAATPNYGRHFYFDFPANLMAPNDIMHWCQDMASEYPWEKRECGHIPKGIEVIRESDDI